MQYRARRYPASRPVTVRVVDGSGEAHLMDVAEGGVKLMVDGLVPGEAVSLGVAGMTLRGTVRWVRDGHAGVQFDEPLTSQAVREVAGLPIAPTAKLREDARRAKGRWLPG